MAELDADHMHDLARADRIRPWYSTIDLHARSYTPARTCAHELVDWYRRHAERREEHNVQYADQVQHPGRELSILHGNATAAAVSVNAPIQSLECITRHSRARSPANMGRSRELVIAIVHVMCACVLHLAANARMSHPRGYTDRAECRAREHSR